jgi:hypothetical protein
MTTDHPGDPVLPIPSFAPNVEPVDSGFASLRPDLPVLPYAGTSGHSGSDTSRERAARADADGTTAQRQLDTLAHLDHAGAEGLTYRELGDLTGMHHGQSSGSLSNLHMVGEIERLTEARNRCKVYVLPAYVNGRETEPYGRKRRALPVTAIAPSRRIREWVVAAEENRRPHVVVNTSDLRILLNLILDTYGDPE